MRRADRLFEIIQLLRAAQAPMTAAQLGEVLEVTPRTIYRDVGALQAMRVPIEGGTGIGYVMRSGYNLPPLMFTVDEVEAMMVGLGLIRRTGDRGLEAAAKRVADKVATVLPADRLRDLERHGLHVSEWGAASPTALDLELVRRAIREARKLTIAYRNEREEATERTIQPLALIYYIEVVVVAAWCELRQDFRHFRADRVRRCEAVDEFFADRADELRSVWLATR